MANPFRAAATAISRPTGTKAGHSTAPLFATDGSGSLARWNDWRTDVAIRDGYKASVWVYACVKRINDALGSVPCVVKKYRRGSGGQTWEVVAKHGAARVINQPGLGVTRQTLMAHVGSGLMLGGNALLWKNIISERTGELVNVPVQGVRAVRHRVDFNAVDHYEYRWDGQAVDYQPEEVAHLMLPDPSNPLWGMAPLQAAAKTVDSDVEAVNWNKIALQNRAVTDGVFTLEKNLGRSEFDETRAQIREQYSGSANARTPWVLGNNAKWTPMSLTPLEMDWSATRKMSRVEICAGFGVPLPLVGVYDDATLANIQTARRIFWSETMIPLLDALYGALDLSLLPHYERNTEDYWITYDLTNVDAVRENVQEKADTIAKLVASGVPLNQAVMLVELGIDAVPGGDVGFIGGTMVPLLQAGMSDHDPAAEL